MAAATTKVPVSILPRLPTRPAAQIRTPAQSAAADLHLLRSMFSISSWLLFGALIQTLLVAFLPIRLAFIPPVLILGYRFSYNLAIIFHLIPNPYLKDAIFYHTSAQLPNPTTGEFSPTPSNEGIAVLHLGAKINHPLGGFAPHAQSLIKHAERMYKELDEEANRSNGYLGGQNFSTVDEKGCIELTFLAYWRSNDDIHAFAYGPAHRKGWEWWNSVPKEDIKHLAINHEIFQAAPGQWETIYINHQPTLLGGTNSFRPGDKTIGGTVEDSWQVNLLDARRGKLRTSAGRLGRDKEELKGKFGYVPIPAKDEPYGDGRETGGLVQAAVKA